MPLSPFTIWTTADRTRYFLLPDDGDSLTLPPGPLAIRAPLGKHQSVAPQALLAYELTEHQAKIWVASELTGILEALPTNQQSTGATIMAAAHLVRQLPELICLSANPQTLPQARELGAALDRQLAAGGFESHSAFSQLPGRIASIHTDPAIVEKSREVAAELRRVSQKIEIPAVRHFVEQISATLEQKNNNR